MKLFQSQDLINARIGECRMSATISFSNNRQWTPSLPRNPIPDIFRGQSSLDQLAHHLFEFEPTQRGLGLQFPEGWVRQIQGCSHKNIFTSDAAVVNFISNNPKKYSK